MRYTGGWVPIPRDILNDLKGRYFEQSLFMRLALMANYDEGQAAFTWGGQPRVLKRGEVLTALSELAESERNDEVHRVRRALDVLEKRNLIQQESSRSGRVITVLFLAEERQTKRQTPPENPADAGAKSGRQNGRQNGRPENGPSNGNDSRNENEDSEGGRQNGSQFGRQGAEIRQTPPENPADKTALSKEFQELNNKKNTGDFKFSSVNVPELIWHSLMVFGEKESEKARELFGELGWQVCRAHGGWAKLRKIVVPKNHIFEIKAYRETCLKIESGKLTLPDEAAPPSAVIAPQQDFSQQLEIQRSPEDEQEFDALSAATRELGVVGDLQKILKRAEEIRLAREFGPMLKRTADQLQEFA